MRAPMRSWTLVPRREKCGISRPAWLARTLRFLAPRMRLSAGGRMRGWVFGCVALGVACGGRAARHEGPSEPGAGGDATGGAGVTAPPESEPRGGDAGKRSIADDGARSGMAPMGAGTGGTAGTRPDCRHRTDCRHWTRRGCRRDLRRCGDGRGMQEEHGATRTALSNGRRLHERRASVRAVAKRFRLPARPNAHGLRRRRRLRCGTGVFGKL